MSSRERTGKNKFHSRRRTLALIGSALLAAPFVSACQPLYGTTPGGARLKDVMASLEITEIPGRVGQRVRNELIFGVTGGGRPPRAEYRLEISVREWIVDTLVEQTGDAKGQLYHLDAQFKQVVLSGRSAGRAALDRFDPIFSNVRARIDAENRAARVVSDGIKTRIAAFLSSTA